MFLIIWNPFGPIWTLLDHFKQKLIFCFGAPPPNHTLYIWGKKSQVTGEWEKEAEGKTKDRSVPDGSDKNHYIVHLSCLMWFIGAAKPRWRVRICFRNIYSSTYDHASKKWTNRRKTAITVITGHSGLLFGKSHCLLGFVTTPACKGRSQNQKLLLCNVYLFGVFSSGIRKIFCFIVCPPFSFAWAEEIYDRQ